MAESVARVKVQATADLKGLDDAARALKGLQQAIAPTDAALSKARLEIIQFGYANKQTKKLIAAQVNALKSLRTEAQVGGQLYENLGRDIDELKNKLNGTSTATQKAASSFEQLGRAAASIQSNLQKQGQSFSAFKRQAGETGKAVGELAAAFNIKFDRAGKAIEDAARQVEILKKNASNIGSMFQGPQKGGGLFEIPRKGLADIQAFSQLVKRLKEQSESAYGKVARISEGLFAIGASGAVVGQVANAFGGVSSAIEAASGFAAKFSGALAGMGSGIKSGIGLGALKSGLNEISLLLNQPANGLANLSQSLGKVQQSLDLLNVPAEAFNNALAALGPTGAAAAGVVALALAKVSEEKRKFLKDFEKEATEGLRSITDETQRLINKLAQLSEAFRGAASMNELQALRAGGAARFNETPAGTDASRRAANTIASAEARIKAEGMAQAEVLEAARQRYRGTTESVDALSERLAYLQQAMKYVDQSTAEGKAEFAAFSNEANKVKGQIDQLSNSYRTVADAIRDAAQAQGEYANQSTVNNYLNRAATRQQEELVAAARTALSRPQTPLLPAAGQTSFAGTYGPGGIGGGARLGTGGALDAQGRPRGNAETPFIIGTENVGIGTAVYRGAQRTEMEIAGAAAALERDMRTAAAAVNNADKAVEELKQAFSELIQPIEKVAKSEFFSPNSINALKARREQIDRERNAVDMLGDDYQRLSRELAKVDKQLERTQPGGLRGKIGYIGQGIGAAASAGIFGGPEGAIGGLLGGGVGALLGGPAGFAAGSFIGSSGGAYAGMARQQLGQFSTYAADISKLEIALKGVTKTQEEYQRALAASASVTRDFNVPQLEATKGITQLSAAVIGAGGKVADAEVVFRNVTAAIKASGGSAEDVQGALTALGQIFSKGKVSAEELQGQLGERLPGAVTMFAKATGRTLPQLQKDLEQGVVGLADLMKFIVSDQGLGQFEQRAKNVAKSSADAGARLTATFNDTKRAIGDALLPLGAQIQDSLGKALRDATPALVQFAKGAAALTKFLVDNAAAIAQVIGAISKFAVALAGASLAVKGFNLVVALSGTVMGAARQGLALLAASFGTTSAQAVVAQNRLTAFGTTLKTLARAAAAPLIITVGIVGAQLVIDYFNRIKSARDSLTKTKSAATGEEWLNDIGGKSLDKGRLTNAIDEVGKAYEEAADKVAKLRKERDYLQGEAKRALGGGAIRAVAQLEEVNANLTLAEAQVKLLESRYKAGIARLPNAPNAANPLAGLTDFSNAAGKGDLDRSALDKARAEAERLAAEQQRLNEATAKAEIQLAQTVFNNQIELIKKRWDYEEERLQRQRDLQAGALEGERAETRRAANEFLARIESIRRSVREATLGVVVAEQNAAFGARMEAVTGQGLSGGGVPLSSTGIVARTGNTGQSTGAHLDLRWGDGRPITKADADKYFLVNGRAPSSFGVTSPYGPRNLFGRSFHGGIDFGTPAGSAITLKGGATFGRNLGNTGAGGYAIEVMTPEGTMRALHLMANSAIKTSPAGVAAQTRRNVAAAGKAGSSSAEATQAANLLNLTAEQAKLLLSDEAQKYAQDRTQSLRNEAKALEDNNALVLKRIKLEQSGMRPELIEAQLKVAEIEQRQLERTLELKQLIKEAQDNNDTVALDGYQKELDLVNSTLDRQIAAYNALAQAQIAPGVALANYIGQLKLQLDQLTNVENVLISIGQTVETQMSSAMSTAVTSVVTGSGSIKQALSDMFASIGQSFIKMATDIIAKQLVMITLQTVLKALGLGFGGGGGLEPNTAAGNAGFMDRVFSTDLAGSAYPFAKGGVMTGRGPIPLKKYARGGIANSPQMALFGEGSTPEAFVPLPDGRRIPVSLKNQDKMNEIMGRSPVQQQSPTLNMTFQTTNIGGVEYVSRDQLEAAMAETRKAASRDGAKRGMSMTLDRLQQSPTTRRQVGLR